MKTDILVSHVIVEEYFEKIGNDVYRLYRLGGKGEWIKELTPYKEVPFVKIAPMTPHDELKKLLNEIDTNARTLQKGLCCYSTIEGDNHTCDCKFAGSDTFFLGKLTGYEQTGCCEARSIIWAIPKLKAFLAAERKAAVEEALEMIGLGSVAPRGYEGNPLWAIASANLERQKKAVLAKLTEPEERS